MPSTITSNMNLTVPTVLQQPGPQWAQDVNGDLATIDSHDHTTGKGVRVPTAGLNVNADLPFTSAGAYYGPISAAYYGYQAQTAPTAGTHLASTFVDAAGNLYYRTPAGTDVPIIQGGVVPPSGTGLYNGFYGNYAAAGPSTNAVAFYRAANSTFEFYSPLGAGSSTPANYAQVAPIYAKRFITMGTADLPFIQANSGTTTFGGAPKGGWAMRPYGAAIDSTWGIAWDNINGPTSLNGAYSHYAFAVSNPYANQIMRNNAGVNMVDSTGAPTGSPSVAHEVWYFDATTGPRVIGQYNSLSNTAAGSYDGTGGRIAYRAGSSGWNNSGSTALSTANIYYAGFMDYVWVGSTATNRVGSLRLIPQFNNNSVITGNMNYGLDVTAFAAGLNGIGVGLGGPATAAAQFTCYGVLIPDADSTRDIGLTGSRFAAVYARSLRATGGIALPDGVLGNTNFTANTTAVGTSAASFFQPTSTLTGPTGSGGSYSRSNQTIMWCNIAYAGANTVSVNGSYGATGVVCSTPAAGVGYKRLDVTLTQTVNTSNVVVMATVQSSDATNLALGVNQAWMSAANVASFIIQLGGGAVAGFYVQVVGQL